MVVTRFRLRSLALVCLLVALAGCSPPAAAPQDTATPAATATLPPAPSAAPTTRSLQAEQAFRAKMMTDYLARLAQLPGTVTAEELAAGQAYKVDVREPAEYSQGFIEGSVNIPLRTLTRQLDALPDPEQPIVVICGSGHRSAIAMAALQILGYKDVRSLAGGLSAWQKAKLPMVTAPAPQIARGTAPGVDPDFLAVLDKYLRETLPQDYGMASPRDMSAAVAESLLALPPTLIDVRTPDQFASGNISGSVNIELTGLLDRLEDIPFTQDISD